MQDFTLNYKSCLRRNICLALPLPVVCYELWGESNWLGEGGEGEEETYYIVDQNVLYFPNDS